MDGITPFNLEKENEEGIQVGEFLLIRYFRWKRVLHLEERSRRSALGIRSVSSRFG